MRNFRFYKELNIILNDPKLLITLPLALLIMPVVISIRKIILIRFGLIHSDRIGHFAANTELYLCHKKNDRNNPRIKIDLLYFPTKPCNNFLAKIIKRKTKILPKYIIRPFCLISRNFKFLNLHIAGRPPMSDHDIHNYYEKFKNQLNLNHYEIKTGNEIIRKVNPKNKPIILLTIRDAKYLQEKTKSNNFAYHNHRDDEIERYKILVNHMIKKGFFVIRMGKIVKKKLKINNVNFLDYPFSKLRSDFMDIFLAHKCFLCISNVTGYDAVPTIFRKPMLFFGSIPIGFMLTSSKKFINTTYDHYSIKYNRKLTLEEIFKFGLDCKFKATDFKKLKIKLVKFKPELMVKIFNDSLIYINKDFKINNSMKNINTIFKIKYFECLKKYSKNSSFKYHGKIRSYFPKSWLIDKKYFLK